MNLIVDIGNTFTKLFVFENDEIAYFHQFNTNEKYAVNELFIEYPLITNAIISSVAEVPEELVSQIKKQVQILIMLDAETELPIKNLYKTPETLGKDRLAGIVGAYNIFPKQNVLAIDAGTAITFDFINEKGEYLGGNISPGLNMRFSALNHFTNKLPLLQKQEQFPLIGAGTDEAIIAGVQNGIIFEIESYIARFSADFAELKVILTGGDTFFFAHKLKCTIFAQPFLVAIGLNRILQNNAEKN